MNQVVPRQLNVATRNAVMQAMDASSILLLAFALCITSWVVWAVLGASAGAVVATPQQERMASVPYCMPGAPVTGCACPWAKDSMCRALAQTSCAKLRISEGQVETTPLATAAILGAAQTGNLAFVYAPKTPRATTLDALKAWVKQRAGGCTVVIALAPGGSAPDHGSLATGRWLAGELEYENAHFRVMTAFGLHEYRAAFAGASKVAAFADAAPIQFNLSTATQLNDPETERFLTTTLERGALFAVVVGRAPVVPQTAPSR